MRKLKHLLVLTMLVGLGFVEGCELLDLIGPGSKCADTDLDQILYDKFQLVLQVPDYAQVSDLHLLRNAYKIELKGTMQTYSM
jgi:hypothetical protein